MKPKQTLSDHLMQLVKIVPQLISVIRRHILDYVADTLSGTNEHFPYLPFLTDSTLIHFDSE